MPDIPRGTSTNAVTTLGETFRSRIDDFGDRDWIRIELKKGDWIQVDLRGRGADPLEDPFLRIYDRDRLLVTENDDGPGTGLNSQVIFQATYTGSYYVEASGLDGDYTGQYAIDAQKVAPPPAEQSLYWGSQMPDTTITVYFAPDGESYDGYTSEGFNAYEKAQFQKVFNRLEAVSDLQFVITEDPNADFRLVLDTDEMRFETDPALAFFNPPETRNEGVGVFNGAFWDRQAGGDLEVGGEGFVTITHEVLHGLGLAHPHDNGGGSSVMPGVTADFDDYGDFDLNQGIFTTMSYNSGYHTGSTGSGPRSSYGFESGPMALDIAVLQSLYGTGDGHKVGDTTYKLPDQNKTGTKWQAIWDTAGIDQILYEGTRDTVIDLRAATLIPGVGAGGFVSAAKGIAGGYTIAKGVWIETAQSGGGADRLTGNGRDNALIAGAGADVLNGRGGDDRLIGGKGQDDLSGGNGADTLQGNNGDDTLTGARGSDDLIGGDGDDMLKGGNGADVLRGQANADVLRGGKGADMLHGGAGADTFDFDSQSESRAGAPGRDRISDFGRGDDRIDLSGIDADSTTGGNQAFDFIGNAGFSGAGQLRIATLGADRLVQADRNGDGIADVEILLLGASGIGAGDFIL